MKMGDIVSVRGHDGGIYYAQIRGLLEDQFCEKSAALTWLLPTENSPPPEKGFDPDTYIIGETSNCFFLQLQAIHVI
jgi:GATA zinc finger domain-containing protein 1